MPPQRLLSLRDRQAGQLGDDFHRCRCIEMVLEIRDNLARQLKIAGRLGLERQCHRASGAAFERDQVRDDALHLPRIGVHHVAAGDARLEAQRRALDRRRDALRHQIGQHIRDPHRVVGAVVAAPVRFIDLFLDGLALERAVRKRVGGEDIEVVGRQELLELRPRLRVLGQPFGRVGGDARADAERLVGTEPALHRGQIARQAVPQLIPGVGRVDQRRIGQVAEFVVELHCRFLQVAPGRRPGRRLGNPIHASSPKPSAP